MQQTDAGILRLDYIRIADSIRDKLRAGKDFEEAASLATAELAETNRIVAQMNDNARYELKLAIKKQVGAILGARPHRKKDEAEKSTPVPTDFSKWKLIEDRERSVRFVDDTGIEYHFIQDGAHGVLVTSITGSLRKAPSPEAIRYAKMHFASKAKSTSASKVKAKTYPRIKKLGKEKILVLISKDYSGEFIAGARAEKISQWFKGSEAVLPSEIPIDVRKSAFKFAKSYFVNLFRNTRDLF